MDTIAKVKDEQGERIRQAWADLQTQAEETGEMYSLQDFEDVFEDRDPFEFL